MENERVAVSNSPANADHWRSEHSQCITDCDSDSNTFEDDQPVAKIKPEVELKEESDGFVYKTDTQGNLKLVCPDVNIPSSNSDICETSLNEISPSSHFGESSVHLKHEYLPDKIIVSQGDHIKDHIDTEIPIDTTVDVARYSDSFPSYSPHSIITYASEDEPFDVPSNVYPDLNLEWRLKGLPESLNNFFKKHFDDITDEKTALKASDVPRSFSFSALSGGSSKICSKAEQTVSSASDLDDNVYKGCEKEPLADFSTFQGETSSNKGDMRKKESISKTSDLTEAEKKKLYRKKIKDTNPEFWQIIKQRDAAQKRQKRAHRQMIAREMQMQLDRGSSHSESVQTLHLDALKERYPDLWEQLLHTVPEVRNRIDHKSRGAKSVTAYKDIIEAEKKRIYREKMKREKPEMWERQKARDAQRRSSQRLMKNPKRVYRTEAIKMEKLNNNNPSPPQQNLTYLQNLEVNQDHFSSDQNTCSNLTPLQSVSLAETNYDDACVDSLIASNSAFSNSREVPLCNDTKYSNVSIKMEDNPSSTQSKILWFWNDTPDVSSIHKSIPANQGAIPSQEIKHPLENVVKNEQINKFDTKDNCKKRGKNKREKE